MNLHSDSSTNFTDVFATNTNSTLSSSLVVSVHTSSWSPSGSITPTPAPMVMNGENSIGCLDNCDERYVSYLRFIAGILILFLGVFLYFKCASMGPRREADNLRDTANPGVPNAAPSPMADEPPTTPNARRNSRSAAGGMSLSQRNQFVTQFLPTKLFKASSRDKDNAVDWEPHASTELSSLPPSENMTVSSIPYGHNDREEKEQQQQQQPTSVTPETPPGPMSPMVQPLPVPECAVCLEAFCQNDEICTSNNPDCPHVFHVKCMHSWLLRQEECPCCRRPYLQVDPKQELLF